MSVTMTRDARAYDSASCAWKDFTAGQVLSGGEENWVRAMLPAHFWAGAGMAPDQVASLVPVVQVPDVPAAAVESPTDLADALPVPAPAEELEEVAEELEELEEDIADVPSGEYDPGEHPVSDVLAYARAHPDERAGILAAEQAGKARTTILKTLAD